MRGAYRPIPAWWRDSACGAWGRGSLAPRRLDSGLSPFMTLLKPVDRTTIATEVKLAPISEGNQSLAPTRNPTRAHTAFVLALITADEVHELPHQKQVDL